jgi:hypothetical protein
MALHYRRSIKILPGVRLNLSNHGWSVTFGGRHGPHHTRSSDGRSSTSVNLPGGFSWRRRNR